MKKGKLLQKKRLNNSNDITVCFSGGIDSTYLSYITGKELGGRVHLVTLLHNYGHLFPSLCYRHVEDLKKLLGRENVIHKFIHIKPIFKKILIETLWKDIKKYRSMAIWCIACHLSMYTYIAVYNLLHQIPYVMLASSVGGKEYAPVSLNVTTEEIKNFYREYGIQFSTPIIDENIMKTDEKKHLRKVGIWPGLVIGKGTVGVQPICIPGFIQTWPDLFFDIHPYYDENKIQKFIRDKREIMNLYIKDCFKKQNLPLNKYIEKLKGRNIEYE